MADLPAKSENKGLVGKLPLTLQDAMGAWFSNNASVGIGDLRAPITLEALQRTETADHWIVNRRKLSRADVMELMLDMVAQGYSIPALLKVPGMPKHRTVMTWLIEYKPFAELMDVAEKMYSLVLADEALEILDGSNDEKQAFRDKSRADLRMKLAEVMNAKKFGKKQQVDVTHHLDDLTSPEVWSRFRSILITHQNMIQQNTGVKIEVPVIDAEVVETKEEVEAPPPNPMTLGMQGIPDPNWENI